MAKMKLSKMAVFVAVLMLLTIFPASVTHSGQGGHEPDIEIVNVAVYNVSELEKDTGNEDDAENWGDTVTYGMIASIDGKIWEKDGKTYKFATHIVEFEDIVDGILSNGNYKLFVAPGDSDYFEDQLNHPSLAETFRENIKNFVDDGGGYIGTCSGALFACESWELSGASLASDGPYEEPEWWGDPSLSLGIVDATLCSRWCHENVYGHRHIIDDSDFGGIPLRSYIYDEEPLKDFAGRKSLRYWGGGYFKDPGQSVTELAYYWDDADEHESTQLHKFGIWTPVVETDLWRNASILKTTYGNGRVIIFAQHPELLTWNWNSGITDENLLHTKYIYDAGTPTVNYRGIIADSAIWAVE